MIFANQMAKIDINGRIACIGEELKDCLNVKSNFTEQFLNNKGLSKAHDYDIVETYLLNTKVGQSHKKFVNNTKSLLIYDTGIKRLISNRRQSESIEIAKKFELSLNFIKEREYLNIIKESFSDWDSIQQYYVERDNGGKYYIDLYFKDQNIAVECDEYNHIDRTDNDEFERQQYIENKLGCTFVRFNPDDKSFSIGKVIKEIRNVYEKNIRLKFPITLFDEDELTKEIESDNMNLTLKNTVLKYIQDLQCCFEEEGYIYSLNISTNPLNNESFVCNNKEPLFSLNHLEKVFLEYDNDNSGRLTVVVKPKDDTIKTNIWFIFEKNKLFVQVPSKRKENTEQKTIKQYIENLNIN